ncbi:terminase large subunit [Gordonia phage RedWattleHog]|uniref:Terminase n=1 Tax=Gordonia phage Stormageddon TaxID=2656541 RepID=A0A649VRP1_9CAUD|nr:terminase [Gordonia phage Stormageddon]QGJ94864.1 terminase [Gordonia phage Stormageddon]QLF83505.1 terminase large subunit [Gordonia phage RedWattleHog]
MPTRNKAQSELINTSAFDPVVNFRSVLSAEPPWDSIVDFATHRSFCGQRLYPRQLTLLKLIYLETETMTAFDLDVIEQWREGFKNPDMPEGVNEDIWTRVEYLKQRGYRHFPHIEAIIGRRGSKGKVGGILGAEKLAYMFSLDNWQNHYGVSPGKDGYMSVVATNSIQAKKFQFADIRETVESCRYLQPHIAELKDYTLAIRTPADVRRIAYMHKNKIPIDHQIATLHAVAMSSNSSSGRGATGFANFFDEFAHMISGTGSQRSSEEVYEAYQPSLDQFGQDSLTYIPSSPFTMVGHFYSLYEQGKVLMSEYDPDTGTSNFTEKTAKQLGLSDGDAEEKLIEVTANPEMLVVQLPSWGLYQDWQKSPSLGGPKFKRPIQAYDERMMRLERSNPAKFAVERRSQFASVLDAFLDPKKVEAMFNPVPWREPGKLAAQDKGRLDRRYYAHVDPGLTNANFAFAIGHLEDAPAELDPEGTAWPHVIIDYLKVWKPGDYEDHTIDYVQVQREIAETLRKFPSMVEFSADQWNSAGMLAALREEFGTTMTVRQETFTEAANQERMERFKSALNLGWIHAYKDDFYEGGQKFAASDTNQSLLEMEAKFLQRKPNGKVDKQEIGPVTTKDLFDAVNVITDRMLKDYLDRWQSKMLGLHTPAVGSTNVNGLRSGRDIDRLNALKTGRNLASTEAPLSARDKLRAQSREKAFARTQRSGAYSSRLRGRG